MYPVDITLIEKCRQAEAALSKKYRNFSLFGLFERDETAGKWDIIVSADWLSRDRASIQLIVDALVPLVSKDEWLRVSTIVPLEASTDFVQVITRKFNVEHGLEEISNVIFAGILINNAVIITANRHVADTMQMAV